MTDPLQNGLYERKYSVSKSRLDQGFRFMPRCTVCWKNLLTDEYWSTDKEKRALSKSFFCPSLFTSLLFKIQIMKVIRFVYTV